MTHDRDHPVPAEPRAERAERAQLPETEAGRPHSAQCARSARTAGDAHAAAYRLPQVLLDIASEVEADAIDLKHRDAARCTPRRAMTCNVGAPPHDKTCSRRRDVPAAAIVIPTASDRQQRRERTHEEADRKQRWQLAVHPLLDGLPRSRGCPARADHAGRGHFPGRALHAGRGGAQGVLCVVRQQERVGIKSNRGRRPAHEGPRRNVQGGRADACGSVPASGARAGSAPPCLRQHQRGRHPRKREESRSLYSRAQHVSRPVGVTQCRGEAVS